jgi:hypothetical protein
VEARLEDAVPEEASRARCVTAGRGDREASMERLPLGRGDRGTSCDVGACREDAVSEASRVKDMVLFLVGDGGGACSS